MSGLNKKLKTTKIFNFSEEDKRLIIEDYLQSGLTKKEIWNKYTGRDEEHGAILYWMRKYGYISNNKEKSIIFAPKRGIMLSKNQKQESNLDFENLQLKKRIAALEKQLQESEMKSIAWQTLVEIAERELNINIKKNFNTKPSKR